jgi:hypothetical protein
MEVNSSSLWLQLLGWTANTQYLVLKIIINNKGRVNSGMSIVKKMGLVPTNKENDKPKTDIKILSTEAY